MPLGPHETQLRHAHAAPNPRSTRQPDVQLRRRRPSTTAARDGLIHPDLGSLRSAISIAPTPSEPCSSGSAEHANAGLITMDADDFAARTMSRTEIPRPRSLAAYTIPFGSTSLLADHLGISIFDCVDPSIVAARGRAGVNSACACSESPVLQLGELWIAIQAALLCEQGTTFWCDEASTHPGPSLRSPQPISSASIRTGSTTRRASLRSMRRAPSWRHVSTSTENPVRARRRTTDSHQFPSRSAR